MDVCLRCYQSCRVTLSLTTKRVWSSLGFAGALSFPQFQPCARLNPKRHHLVCSPHLSGQRKGTKATSHLQVSALHAHSSTENTSATADALRPLRKGDQINVEIMRVGYGGSSVGRIIPDIPYRTEDLDLPVYAPKGACPGDIVQCTVSRVRRRHTRPNGLPNKHPPGAIPGETSSRSYVEALFTRLLTRSEFAHTPVCKHFGNFHLGGGGCGGCSTMHVPYDIQLGEKQAQMDSLFSQISSQHCTGVRPIIPCDTTFNYRNKMEFTFGRRWYVNLKEKHNNEAVKQFALGLHAPQRFDKVIEISECHIHSEIGNSILDVIRRNAEKMFLEPYDTKMNTGYLRNIGIRTSTNAAGEREIMVNIITSPCEVPERLVPLAEQLMDTFPDVVCVVQNIRGLTGVHVTEEEQERLLRGDRSYIEQTVLGKTFRISANSFFQTNPKQAVVLIDEVRKAVQLTKSDVLLDLFCGTGTIGLCLANDAKHVYGIDIITSAIKDAQVNAESNNIRNTTFIQTDLEKLKAAKKNTNLIPRADVIVCDPPRAGLHPDLIKFLAAARSKRIVYVSCNPMTQVRDIMQLTNLVPGLYRISRIQPVDMFPHTHHIECVTTLDRR